MNVIEESRQKRPIAMAGLRLTMLCDHPDKRTDDEYWALAKVLLGKKNVGQYEKQCFWSDRDWGNYPEPECHNPDRNIEPEREAPTHSRMEHER